MAKKDVDGRNKSGHDVSGAHAIYFCRVDRPGIQGDQRHHVIPQIGDDGRSDFNAEMVRGFGQSATFLRLRLGIKSQSLMSIAQRIIESSPAEKQPGRSGNQMPMALSAPASSTMAT